MEQVLRLIDDVERRIKREKNAIDIENTILGVGYRTPGNANKLDTYTRLLAYTTAIRALLAVHEAHSAVYLCRQAERLARINLEGSYYLDVLARDIIEFWRIDA